MKTFRSCSLTLLHSLTETILIFQWFVFHHVVFYQVILEQELHKMLKENIVTVGSDIKIY